MSKRKITWAENAKQEFNDAINYIRQDSEKNAEKVRSKILDKINQLSDNKIDHRNDPYKKDNDGSYFCFEILKHRITYHISNEQITIIRIRHTKQNPQPY